MVTLEEYVGLTILIAVGGTTRMLLVFARKNGFDWSKFRIEEVWDTFLASVMTIIATGVTNEFLDLGLDTSKGLTLLMAFCFGFIGTDLWHQIQSKIDQRKGLRTTKVSYN